MATWRGLSVSVILLISALSLSISCSYFDSWPWLNVNCVRLSALQRSWNLSDDVSGSFKTRLWSSSQRTSFTFDLDICIIIIFNLESAIVFRREKNNWEVQTKACEIFWWSRRLLFQFSGYETNHLALWRRRILITLYQPKRESSKKVLLGQFL